MHVHLCATLQTEPIRRHRTAGLQVNPTETLKARNLLAHRVQLAFKLYRLLIVVVQNEVLVVQLQNLVLFCPELDSAIFCNAIRVSIKQSK